MQHAFLVEIGTEELPPKALRSLAKLFAAKFKNQLEQVDLQYGEVLWYASPRRLALKIIDLSANQSDHIIEKRGPAVSQAFDSTGKPTRATERWMRSCGITIEQVERLVTNKGEWLFHRVIHKGCPSQELLFRMVSNALHNIPAQMLMRWGDKDVYFVRPVHTFIMLLGDQLLEGELFGVQSSRLIRGHRFMGEISLTIDTAEQYPEILRKRGKVIADYNERKLLIKNEVNKIAQKLGGTAELSDNLLEEVTSLVEWPVVLTAKFENRFLAIPAEALVHTMKGNQKYFPVYDKIGNLMSNFIFVVNIESSDPQQIITGNEKVVRSRLEDAEFFFKADCKNRLEEYLPRLQTILFQKQLGTLRDKTDRLAALASWIAEKIGADVNHARRAGILSKCDLITNMVFEFPNTQGVMGMHYARIDGEKEDVALAIKEQYQPRFSSDALPSNNISDSLAIADKIDTLVGICGINQQPAGDTDPFALRRAALSILRIIVDKGYDIDLLSLIQRTVQLYGNKLTNKNVSDDVIKFILRRFRTWYYEKGYRIDTIQSVLACNPTKPVDFDARVKAVTCFRTSAEVVSLLAVNKRVANMLYKSKEKLNDNIDDAVLEAPEEVSLAHNLVILQDKLVPLLFNKQYYLVLLELASLREVTDSFLNNVMIMHSNVRIRLNRLTLLSQLHNLFLQVADISLLK